MKPIKTNPSIFIILIFLFCECSNGTSEHESEFKIPIAKHNLSYISYDDKLDEENYIICDSTKFASGRNRVKYKGGNHQLRADITTEFQFKSEYESFTGYIVIHFLVNCEGKIGRFRSNPLQMDFSKSNAPSDLRNHLISIVKNLDNWDTDSLDKKEYSKFINLKIKNGKIEHIVL